MTHLYLKTIMVIPGQPSMTHIAELEPIDALVCRPLRMLEISEEGAVSGAYRRTPATLEHFAAPPQDTIPHPDQWQGLDGIEAISVAPSEFEALWLEAEQKFESLR